MQRITLGSLADVSLADARDKAAALRAAVVDGGDPQAERRVARQTPVLTFEKLAERYLNEYAKPRKASWKNDRDYLKRPIEAWGQRDPRSITRRDAIDLLDSIKTVAPISCNRTHSVLVTMFNWAVEEELLDNTPMARLRKRAVETAKDRVLTDPEVAALWQVLLDPEGTSIDVADCLRFLMLVGCRPAEAAGMTQNEIHDLDGAEPRWELSAARTKQRRPHITPLCPMACDLLRGVVARRQAEGEEVSVFASRFGSRQTVARHSLSQALRRLAPRLPQSFRDQPATPHDVGRRTVATGLARLGVPREDRMAVLGHALGDVHDRHYDQYERLDEKRRALEKWEQHLRLIGRPAPTGRVVEMPRRRQGRAQ
jgi:integrase